MLFTDAKDQLEVDAFTTGTGTNEPTGIVTALSGGGSEVFHATNSSVSAADVYAALEAVPPRFRPNAQWLMSLENIHELRQLDTNGILSLTLGDFTQGSPARLLGKGLNECSALDTTLTTATNSFAMVGDFARHYLIADRLGATVEYVPHVIGDAQRPIATRGWFLWWRTGATATTTNGFCLSSNPGA